MTNHKVTVFMALYNGEQYVRESIESILNQAYADFTFLIINDGSTDESVRIVESYGDPRIRLVHNDGNMGLIYTLNRGFELVHTEYLVRQDADDISATNRIERLLNYMEAHRDVTICSSWFKYFGKTERVIEQEIDHEDIKIKALSRCPLTHGAGIFRVNEFLKNELLYDSDYKHAEDYEMLARACSSVRLHNLPEVLYHVRTHDTQISFVHHSFQQEMDNSIRLKYLRNALGLDLAGRQKVLYFKLIRPLIRRTENEDLTGLADVADALIKANSTYHCFDNEKLLRYLKDNIKVIMRIRRKYYPGLIRKYLLLGKRYDFRFALFEEIKFFIRCMLYAKT